MIFGKSDRKKEGGSPPPVLRCSFCNKSQRDVKKLIAGPKIYICDECVGICLDIIREDRILDPGSQARPESEEAAVLNDPPLEVRPVRCGFCGAVRPVEFCLPIQNRGWLCGGCLDAVKEVLDASSPEA